MHGNKNKSKEEKKEESKILNQFYCSPLWYVYVLFLL